MGKSELRWADAALRGRGLLGEHFTRDVARRKDGVGPRRKSFIPIQQAVCMAEIMSEKG